MNVVVSARLEAGFKIPDAAFYGFLRQRVPSGLPSPLLDASQNFTLIDALVHTIASMIFAHSSDVQTRTLTSAVALNLIGPQYAAQIPDLVRQLQALHTTDLLNQPYLIGKATLGQLLGVVQLPQEKQLAFSQALATNTQTLRGFWRTLGDGKHGFTAQEASNIERTLSVGAFVKNHLPLVQLLLERFAAGTYKTLPDLARLSQQDWIALVNQVGPPPSISAAGTATPAEVFARVVYARITRTYPTPALSNRVQAGTFVPEPLRASVTRFFQNNQTLELIKHNIPVFVAAQGDKAFEGIPEGDRPAVIDNARRFQRVLRVVQKIDAAETLLTLNIHSATQIANMGLQRFSLTATQAGITKREANRIYQAAAQRYAGVIALYTQYNRDSIGVWPQAIGNTSDLNQPTQQAIQRDDSLATLFGSQDFCEVDSCTSVLSPAAYLCDLLLWLRNHPQGAQTALDVLDKRRADIRHLLLDCPNTETPLPYIDLVNELLADAIAPALDPNSTIDPTWKQTTADKTAAELRAAPQYFNQPAYVTLFSASYPHTLPYSAGIDELRTYLQQLNLPLWQVRQALLPLHAATTAQQAAVAAERLKMTLHEEDLVTNANFVTKEVAWNITSPETNVAPVQAFLQAASLTYESLLELIQVAFVQGGLNISIQGISDTCDTTVQSLAPSPLDLSFLDRAHRFLRLWRRTGYKMWELDLLLNAPTVGNGALNASTLVALQSFWQLQGATGLAVDQQVAFYQNIDIASHRDTDGTPTLSLYARLFLNPAVTAVAPDADLAALPSGGAITDPVLSDHLPAIQAALAVSAADAATLFGLTNNTLTLANLSLVYRVAALAKASKFSISDLLSVAGLLNPGAGSPAAAVALLLASPAATLAFLAQATVIQQPGFTIDALTYLLTPPPWTTTTQMTQADITNALTTVRQAILNPSGGNVNGSVIAAVAANAHRPADQAIANDVTALILQQLQVPGTGKTLLAFLTDPSMAQNTPITPASYPNQFLAIQLFDKVAVVVRRVRLVATDLNWLLANGTVYGGLDFVNLPVTNVQPALSLGPFLTTLLLLKLSRLFVAAPPASPIQTLYDVIAGVHTGSLPDAASTQAALATITGWTSANIAAFASAIGVAYPADYTAPATYDALRTLQAMANLPTATAAQIISWGGVPANEPAAETMAASALGVVKAQYPNNNDWLTFAPTIMDPIRERRSNALQGYLIGQRDGGGNLIYGDVNGLFDYFLIDVQMTSCQVSTRVVQAYIAVQIFVERCLMNLEAPAVVVDLTKDDTWNQWPQMKRYRIWEANREVFLYPENWLIESQRPNRTEIYQQLEKDVAQGPSTADYLETVVLNYIDRLDGIAHLFVTGTCQDPITGAIYAVARTSADPPVFYLRSLINGAWTGWQKIPLGIKAHQAVPAVYRGRVCLFWLDLKISSEPTQRLPAAQASTNPPNQDVAKYVSLGLDFSIYRDGVWAPAQTAKGKLFDKPIPSFGDLPSPSPPSASDSRSVEALYSIKVQSPAPSPGFGASLFVDVFRLGVLRTHEAFGLEVVDSVDSSSAIHLGRGIFDGHFNDLELRNLLVQDAFFDFFGTFVPLADPLLTHAQSTYGPDAQPLLPLPDNQADPNLTGEPGMVPQSGALSTQPANPSGGPNQTLPLTFTSVAALEQNVGPLLNTAPVPFRVVGPVTDLGFDPATYFFYQDSRRCYYVESQKFYWTGSFWSPNPPSYPDTVPFQVRYTFHRFYHPFTRLFWHQLGGGGLPLLYDPNLQQNPDQIDPSGADVFTFGSFYNPVLSRVHWDLDDVTGQDREFLDFSQNASYGVYNWELFFHIPLYIAGLLSQNLQFEDALTWFNYIFNPTQQGPDPAPQRFWITKPLHNLTSAQILAERINNLLLAVNQGDPSAVNLVQTWRNNPFNPFVLADLRPVSYMKRTVMSYLDNLIAWADNLFASESREALSEATLIYVIASEILGPQPAAVTPPQHADESYDQLEPKLDAFANAMVDIENTMGATGGGGGGGGGMPAPQTFYFKIPPNDRLLGYWTTVADRLFKLRHCQNIQGQALQLALFDAPIDPGLLIAAQAAGVDLGSVLTDLTAPLPNYRFTALYPQALDFVNAVRGYGGALLSALSASDSAQLAVLAATQQQQLLQDASQVLDLQVQQAQSNIDALNQGLALAQQKFNFNNQQAGSFMNSAEQVSADLNTGMLILKAIEAIAYLVAGIAMGFPDFALGVAGFGGSPAAGAKEGGTNIGNAAKTAGAEAASSLASAIDIGARLAATIGSYQHRRDAWVEGAAEATIQIAQANIQIAGATLALQIAQQNQTNQQNQIDRLQKQIDFLTNKFTSQDLYDWMAGQLAETYFQSYRLAYRLCKQVEACYRFELGIQNSSFIQFGYWDSLHKGLLAGESLNHDLRRMQSSYLDQNSRRFEISRYISLASLNPTALQKLLVSGACDFDIPESLFDGDYPGHYNRHLLRMAVSVVYPSPASFDNVKATLTLVSNKVRVSTDLGGGYPENPVGTDARFLYTYAAVPQKIVLSNGQQDPGLFNTAIGSNLVDQRYLPFENAGAVSSWHLEMPQASNEIDVSTVGDIMLHLHYTAVDGGDALKAAVQANNAANLPTSGLQVFSAQSSFPAPPPTLANPFPLPPFQAFVAPPAGGADQTLTVSILDSSFPTWTRGKTISVTSLTVVAVAWPPGNFVVRPQLPLPNANFTLTPVAGVSEPNVCSVTIPLPANTPPGIWTFKLRQDAAPDFRSITANEIGDVFLLLAFQVS